MTRTDTYTDNRMPIMDTETALAKRAADLAAYRANITIGRFANAAAVDNADAAALNIRCEFLRWRMTDLDQNLADLDSKGI